MSQHLIELRNRFKAKYGLDPLFILPPGGGVDAAAMAQAWGQAPWVTWNGPMLSTGTFGGTVMDGSRHRLDNVWLNDWNPVTNTGTPAGDAAGLDAHQSRLDANGNSVLQAALSQAKAQGVTFVSEEGFYNIAEGNSVFRSCHPEWAFPNQHLAAMREFTDPDCNSLIFEAEGCDTSYKITNSDNRGGSYRRQWYSDTTLDVYRPLHNLQGWIQKSGVPTNLVQISAGFFDVWALDSNGYAWAQRISGTPDQWTKVSPTLQMAGLAVGKMWSWGITLSGTVYSCHRHYPALTESHDGWVLRSGTMAQLDVGETEVWGVYSTGQVFRRPVDTTGDWTQVTGTMDKVWVGDAFAWGIRGTQLYCCRTSTASPVAWTLVDNPNQLTQLDVGSEEVWGVTTAGNIYRMSASGAGSWDSVDGNVTKITVGENYAWALSGSIVLSRQLSGFATGVRPTAPFFKRPATADGQVALSWVPGGGATSYVLRRAATSGGPYTILAAPTVPTYSDTGLTNGSTYYYVVTAMNAIGESVLSEETSAAPETAPAAPGSLVATAASLSQINLTWTNNATNAIGFKIERKTGASGAYSEIKRLAGTGVLSFSDTGAGTGTLFYYRLRAFNGSGVDSPYSNEASATSLGGVTIFVNFQPASATVVPGYMVDGGLVYADRGNGYSYGWTVDNSAQARDRNVNSDQRLDTMVPMQAGAN